MKKFVPAIILFIAGFILTTIGALFKIMHWPAADILLITGVVLDVAASVAAIIILLKKRNSL